MRGRVGLLCSQIIAAVLGHWNMNDSDGCFQVTLWLEARCKSVVKSKRAVIAVPEALVMETHCTKLLSNADKTASTWDPASVASLSSCHLT